LAGRPDAVLSSDAWSHPLTAMKLTLILLIPLAALLALSGILTAVIEILRASARTRRKTRRRE